MAKNVVQAGSEVQVNSMRIVVEGVDGIGKSTLCKKLSEHFKSAIVHNRADTDNSYDYYTSIHEAKHLIQDRSWPSEVVYSRVFNRPIRLTEDELLTLDILYCDTATIILYSSEPKYVMHNDDETLELQAKQFEINELYKTYCTDNNCTDFIMIDVAELDEEALFNKVLEVIT